MPRDRGLMAIAHLAIAARGRMALASVAALCLTAGPLSAKPPAGGTTNSSWFEDLVDPETSVACCGEADCRSVDDRIASDHYEVLIKGIWVSVPAGRILRRM